MTNYIGNHGYLWVDNPRTFTKRSERYVLEHKAVAEEVLGKPLPEKAEVHHVDKNRLNNATSNLVICQDRSYHMLLHQRIRALRECGHADWLKCRICKKYDAPENLRIYGKGRIIHLACQNEYRREKGMNKASYRRAQGWKGWTVLVKREDVVGLEG